jgi:hypothetical protein
VTPSCVGVNGSGLPINIGSSGLFRINLSDFRGFDAVF